MAGYKGGVEEAYLLRITPACFPNRYELLEKLLIITTIQLIILYTNRKIQFTTAGQARDAKNKIININARAGVEPKSYRSKSPSYEQLGVIVVVVVIVGRNPIIFVDESWINMAETQHSSEKL